MSKKKAVCCIGSGFVGGSLTTVLSERNVDVFCYDKSGKMAQGGIYFGAEVDSVSSFVKKAESWERGLTKIYFVCVPTPMKKSGEADTSIVESVLEELASVDGERIAVVKSTVPPGSTELWNKRFADRGLRIVFCPEFLTEANALDDMRNQSRIVLGGPRPHINVVKQFFQQAFPKVPIIKTSSTTAEMVKYFTNVHLAARVVLSCEMFQVCEALDSAGLNVDYDKVVEYAKYDSRLGNSHMNVPGNDGVPAARGHCFPKDLNALIALANQLSVKPTVMKAVWEKNLEMVPPKHRDWEQMVGRAVSEEK